MKTSYIAVIAIVIVAVAGVGVYFAFFNNGGSDSLDVDVVKTTVAVEDYSQLDIEATMEQEGTVQETVDEFLYTLYMSSESEPIGTEEIIFNGARITCNVYQDSFGDKWWNHPETGVTYKISMFGMMESVLSKTNLDLSKTVEEQEVVKETTVTWTTKMSMPTAAGVVEIVGTSTSTVTAVDGDELTVVSKSVASGKADEKLVVTAVDGDDLEINDDQTMTKTEFFAIINLESYKQMLKDQGVKYVESQKIDAGTITTSFGKRHAVTQEFIVGEDDQKKTYEITYGDKGVIYSISEKSTGGKITITLKASSLVTKA
ncbi:MAG: hypothetical protein IJ856_00135 [Candidatus Methanomethylophilaceae archaeon]|nr:hypothetical protein [Candidatus Methanomethylophilaceae archaeon]